MAVISPRINHASSDAAFTATLNLSSGIYNSPIRNDVEMGKVGVLNRYKGQLLVIHGKQPC